MARSFPGTSSDYLSIVNPIGALDITGTALTIVAWVKTTNTGTIALLGKTAGSAGTSIQYDLILSALNPQSRVGDASGFDATSGPSALTSGQWGHVALRKGASVLSTYVNGVPNAVTSTRTIQDTAADFRIGRTLSAGVSAYSGTLAEVAIWNAALTDEEIAAMAHGVNPLLVHPKNLAAYYPLWGLGAAGEPDLSGNSQALSENGTVGTADHAPVGPYVLF